MSLVKYNNNSISGITAASSLPTGAMTLIKSQTASSSATIDFVHGTSDVVLDSTYPIYLFTFINMHPATNNVDFQFNGSDDDSSHSYDVTKTTSFFRAHHPEDDRSATLAYSTGNDLAQGTGFQNLNDNVGNGNDECVSGELWLFNPSSDTYVKHFISRCNSYDYNDASLDFYMAGYFNTTADITAIQFKMSSGNTDAGTIKLYGIKDS